MATKKNAPKKSKTIGISVPMEMAQGIEDRAQSMGISTGMYCKTILRRWIDSGEKLQLSED
jgi:predicted DNA-binding protein